jgi:hypothetical protein
MRLLSVSSPAIALAITDPDVVSEGPVTPHRACYYRADAVVGESRRLMVKVTVPFLAPGYDEGYVVTAYPTRRVKPSERITWTR